MALSLWRRSAHKPSLGRPLCPQNLVHCVQVYIAHKMESDGVENTPI